MRATWILLCVLVGTSLVSANEMSQPLVFHATFDGTLDAAARGAGVPVRVDGPIVYRAGKVGQALLCGEGGASVAYSALGNLRAVGGTVEMWVCPLDWTGSEDEFHVFLEATGAGWLALYRYYQGGILTLLGTGGQNYRAAAGPPIQWQPDQWHHLAGTWCATQLEVFVDGQRVGVQEHAPLPEAFGDTFVVGDRPWHVPRQRQTLIDEIKLYCAPLDGASIARAARGEPVQYQPQMILDATVDPDRGRLHVACDAAGFLGELGTGRYAARGGRSARRPDASERSAIAEFRHDQGNCALSIGDLAPGDYEVQAVLLSDADSAVARTAVPLHVPGPPVWSGNTLGMSDNVVSPWEPLVADAVVPAVSCWGRRYEFGTLLKQVRTAECDVLSEPVRIEAIVGGRTVVLAGPPCELALRSDTRAQLVGQAEVQGLRMRVRHTVEFDGFTWTDVAIEPDAPTQVEELRLTWTTPQAEAALLHADALRWIGNPAGQLAPEGWKSPLIPFFWLGNEQRGLAWYTESGEHWQAAQDRPALEVVPEGDYVRVIVRLIAAPQTITRRLEYGFGMMATPVRPQPRDARRWRMTPGVRSTFDIVWPNDALKWYGYPAPTDPQKFAARVRAAHAQSIQVVPYVNLNYMSAGAPEWQYYGARWSDPARIVTPSDVAAMGYASMGTCPAVRDWQDFILYRINEMIDRYEIDGIYIDCWSPYPCAVGACAWHDAAGQDAPDVADPCVPRNPAARLHAVPGKASASTSDGAHVVGGGDSDAVVHRHAAGRRAIRR